ncbi:type II toxin-antitoxin system RelE family toxin [Pandoraea iniqua]|uniref:type II toxin-antitoxin system RelE family toxin n=1 Tax=Pandoraea iniqua TaxID=2508288 RepID=UPI001242AF36|nr:type II toxin-antitoxin system RelE/ParE family toxin [Pandoraea iniqua]
MTTYDLQFLPSALKEWRALDATIAQQFKARLRDRLRHPRVAASQLRAMPGCYKIKLASVGYRLVYRVEDATVTVLVLAVGKRENLAAYRTARRRIQ